MLHRRERGERRVARPGVVNAQATRRWRGLLLLLIAAVSYLALTPQPPAGVDLGWDKLNHVAAFTALAFSACRGFPDSRGTRLVVLCALLAFGGLIEVLQYFVPGRSSEWGDLLADVIGIASGAFIAAALPWARSMLARRSR